MRLVDWKPPWNALQWDVYPPCDSMQEGEGGDGRGEKEDKKRKGDMCVYAPL